jgi:hypothetical protein
MGWGLAAFSGATDSTQEIMPAMPVTAPQLRRAA